MLKLRIAGIIKESVVDGPGLRYVIFTQGCPHRCDGCHNPATRDFIGGHEVGVAELFRPIKETKLIDGVSFSGGEPFAQAAACAELAKLIKQDRPDLNILVYSGYYHAELIALAKKDEFIKALLQSTDTLIDGPYDATKKSPHLPFRGSSNQNIIDLRK